MKAIKEVMFAVLPIVMFFLFIIFPGVICIMNGCEEKTVEMVTMIWVIFGIPSAMISVLVAGILLNK